MNNVRAEFRLTGYSNWRAMILNLQRATRYKINEKDDGRRHLGIFVQGETVRTGSPPIVAGLATDVAIGESAGHLHLVSAAPDQRTPAGGTVDHAVIAIKRHPFVAVGLIFVFLLIFSGIFNTSNNGTSQPQTANLEEELAGDVAAVLEYEIICSQIGVARVFPMPMEVSEKIGQRARALGIDVNSDQFRQRLKANATKINGSFAAAVGAHKGNKFDDDAVRSLAALGWCDAIRQRLQTRWMTP